MKDIKVIDNFLPEDEFKKIQDILTGFYFPWFYNDFVNNEQDNKRSIITLLHLLLKTFRFLLSNLDEYTSYLH